MMTYTIDGKTYSSGSLLPLPTDQNPKNPEIPAPETEEAMNVTYKINGKTTVYPVTIDAAEVVPYWSQRNTWDILSLKRPPLHNGNKSAVEDHTIPCVIKVFPGAHAAPYSYIYKNVVIPSYKNVVIPS